MVLPTSAATASSRDAFVGLSKLSLGTAQLGMDYGIANKTGCPDEEEAHRILEQSWSSGLRCLDSARAYGDAEARIGVWLAKSGRRPLIVTKLPDLTSFPDRALEAAVRRQFEESLSALGVDRVDGYLAHRASDLQRPMVTATLRALIAENRISQFGASVYGAADFRNAVGVAGLGLIQAPISLFNSAIRATGLLEDCRALGIKVFARSVFLQGVAYLSSNELPAHLQPLAGPLKRLRVLAADIGLEFGELAVLYVRDLPGVSSVVIGAERAVQVASHARAIAMAPLAQDVRKAVDVITGGIPLDIVDPSRWPRSAA